MHETTCYSIYNLTYQKLRAENLTSKNIFIGIKLCYNYGMWWGYNNNITIATRELFKNTKCRAKNS